MPEKQKTHSWTKIQTMIATGAMFGLLALFNVIASLDRSKVFNNPEITSLPTMTATPSRIMKTNNVESHNVDLLSNVSAARVSVTRTRSS